MMVDATVPKRKMPGEKFRIGWDFVRDLERDPVTQALTDSLLSAAASAVIESTGGAAAGVLSGSAGVAGTIAYVAIQAGTAPVDYVVTITVTTALGDIRSRTIRFQVRS